MVEKKFWTPLIILPLKVGGGWGGESGMGINKCAQIYGYPEGMQMDGPQEILDPPDRSAFNGGVRNGVVFPGRPHPNVSLIYYVTSLPF
jgi:hypothetical protein